ncbi:MAG TPA: hypothetical protein VJ974_01115 [Geopsychrobacteraceae bacterium]|nr:hypothetical protein [Geopsychrobacteraceae bacterium]
MIFLPRGTPVKENVNPARVNLPEAMEKLHGGSFSGYLRFDAAKGTGIIIFGKGRLVSALYHSRMSGKRLIAYDAIARVFEVSILGEAVLNIYRITPELAMGIHSLLHGDCVYQGQELKAVDIRSLLDMIKRTSLNGCLRIYTDEKTALIFYEDGHPLGFFHDGSGQLETTADVSLSVAKLPGAKLDLLATRNTEEVMLADLMASADLGLIWRKLRKKLLTD